MEKKNWRSTSEGNFSLFDLLPQIKFRVRSVLLIERSWTPVISSYLATGRRWNHTGKVAALVGILAAKTWFFHRCIRHSTPVIAAIGGWEEEFGGCQTQLLLCLAFVFIFYFYNNKLIPINATSIMCLIIFNLIDATSINVT